MVTEKQKFMFQQSCKDFIALNKLIGQKIKINYVRDGNTLEATGKLYGVKPFDSILYSGGEIPFVGRDRIIRKISVGDEIIYDRSFLVSKFAKIGGNFSKYKLAILGLNPANNSLESINSKINNQENLDKIV